MCEKQRFLKIDGQPVPVSEEVYFEYMRPWWREKKQRIVRQQMEWSIDFFDDGEDENEAVLVDKNTDVQKMVEDKLSLESLHAALDLLTEDELYIIDELYFKEKTEREVAETVSISQKNVNKKKNKILQKIKKFLEN